MVAIRMLSHPNGFLEARERHYERFFGPLTRPIMHSTDIKPVHFVLDGDKVDILWMIPITEAEREFAVQHGSEALHIKFEDVNLSPVVDESRKSVV